MKITSKLTKLDEIDRVVLKLEMERLRLKTETDKAPKKRLSKPENDIKDYKEKVNEQCERENSLITQIWSIKEEVIYINFLKYYIVHNMFWFICSLYFFFWMIDKVNQEMEASEHDYILNGAVELK